MPRIMPEERYFSIPSMDVGADVRINRVLNCWPWVRSLSHSPEAVIHSPAEMMAAWPTTVTRSRWPRALMRRTQKPFSTLWKVTRSTRPARTSCWAVAVSGFMVAVGASLHANPTVCQNFSTRCRAWTSALHLHPRHNHASTCGRQRPTQLRPATRSDRITLEADSNDVAIPVTITRFAAYDNTADKVGKREADFWSQCHLEPSGPRHN